MPETLTTLPRQRRHNVDMPYLTTVWRPESSWATQSTLMATFNDPNSLADFLLRNAVEQLVSAAPKVNHCSLWSVGGASTLLGFTNYAESCESVLQSLPDENFTVGLISNFPLPKKPAPALRQIASLERLNSDHPPLTDETVAQYIRDSCKFDSHLGLAVQHRYAAEFDACESELDTEETAATQAVLGDIDAAIVSADTIVKPDFRANNVRFVCTIELFRRQRWVDAHKLFDVIYHLKSVPTPQPKWPLVQTTACRGWAIRFPIGKFTSSSESANMVFTQGRLFGNVAILW